MQEDANPNCTTCHGEGEVYGYFVDHKAKEIQFTCLYCQHCFPFSTCHWPSDNWEEIGGLDFDIFRNQGYLDVSGW